MLNTILNLFGRSPFAPFQSHMEKVVHCVHRLPELFNAIQHKEYEKAQKIADSIAEEEHHADIIKNDIRNHLPKTLYLAIDRENLLEMLSLQDSIADAAEDVSVLVTIKPLTLPASLRADFDSFLKKNIEAFDAADAVVKEIHELLETSFGGIEAQKVRKMIDDAAFKEHEVDIIERKLLKGLYQAENEMTFATFDLWQRIFIALASISNLSENLANRVRMTLELK